MANFLEKLYKADINISSSGDNVIIAAPGTGHYLAIDFLQIIPSAGVTVQFKDGANNYGGPYPLATGQVVTDENVFQNQDGVITCSDNGAFIINLGGAVQCGGFIRYRIIGN